MDFDQLIAALKDYVILASVIVIAIRKSINCVALQYLINQCMLMNFYLSL